MKNLLIVLGIIGLMIIGGAITSEITRAKIKSEIIKSIEIDGVNELDNGIITLKIDGQYYDYEYEYIKIIKGEI